MKIVVAALVVAVLGLGIYVASLNQRLSAALAENDALRAATNDLGTQLTAPQSGNVSEAELERLRKEAQEAIRLRGELTNLRQQIASANSSAAAAQKAAASAEARAQRQQNPQPAQNQLVEPQTFQSQATGVVAPGQSMALGGWASAPGKVTYAFMTPTIPQPGADSVTVEAKLVEMPEEVATRLRDTVALHPGGQATLTPEQMTAILQTFQQTPGVKVLGAPRLTSVSGNMGSVSIGQMMPTPSGMAHMGPVINVTPTVAPDGSQIQLSVDAKMTVPGQHPQ